MTVVIVRPWCRDRGADRQIWRGDLRAAVARSDQRKLCTKCLNDRLNTVKPRSAIRRLRPSMVCATDLLLGLVMTPSEDCVLSRIRLSFEVRRSCARLREQVVA